MEPVPRWRTGDLVVAVTLVSAMVLAAVLGRQVPLGTRAAAVAAAAGLLVLVVRRRRPVAALAGVMAVVLVEDVLSARAASAPSFLALMVATYSLGRYASRRSAAVAFPLAAGGVVLAQSLSPPTQFSRASSMTFFVAILVLGPGVTGAVVRVRADLGEQLRVAAERLRTARAARIAGAVVREHDRISLDLETVMVRGLDQMRGPAAARDLSEVTQLEHVARETLAQMRGLLVRLRADEHAGPQMDRPVPDLRARIAAALAADAASPQSPVAAPGRWTLWSARQGDWALAALGCALAAGLAATRPWPGRLLGAAIALPLALLRRFPFTAAGLSLAAFVGYSIVARPADPFTGQPPTAVLIVVPLVTAAVCPLPRAVTALLGCLTGGAIAVLADPAARFHVLTAPTAAAVAVGAWAAGRVLRQAGETLAALTDTTRQIEQEQADSARRSAARERARIARELHNAVGHALTIIVMQATAARRVWTSAPDLAHDHATVLRDTTAQTLDDLYLLVLSLAIGGPQTTPGPGPGHAVAALTRAPRGPHPPTASQCSPTGPAPAGSPSRSVPRARHPRLLPSWTRPPTALSRKRSPTPPGTPLARPCASPSATPPMAPRCRSPTTRRHGPRTPSPAPAMASAACASAPRNAAARYTPNRDETAASRSVRSCTVKRVQSPRQAAQPSSQTPCQCRRSGEHQGPARRRPAPRTGRAAHDPGR